MVILLNPLRKPSQNIQVNSTSVSPLATQVIDFVPNSIISLKWFVTIDDNDDQKSATYEILVQNKNNNINYNISSIIGDKIPHIPDVDFSGIEDNVSLIITNSSPAHTLTVHTMRLLIC